MSGAGLFEVTLPAHRGSSSPEKCSNSFSTDIATLPSLSKGEPARPVRLSDHASPFHASPLGQEQALEHQSVIDGVHPAPLRKYTLDARQGLIDG
jgi:hypothetical protein